MKHLAAVQVAADAVALVLAGGIAHLALRASRRTGSSALRAFALGFGMVALGALLGGSVSLLVGRDLLLAVVAQSTLTALGLGVVAWSLYTQGPNIRASDTSGGREP